MDLFPLDAFRNQSEICLPFDKWERFAQNKKCIM